MGNAASKCSAVQPLPDEAIWWKISRHLTLAQWARVAGTCKTSWGLQLHPHVHIKGDLPVAGMLCLRAFSEWCISARDQYVRFMVVCSIPAAQDRVVSTLLYSLGPTLHEGML